MFTLKRIKDGTESIFAVDGVRFADGHVYADLTKGGVLTVDSGIVYVMNANGETVTKYDLK